jgi:hypothetical protein
MGFVQTIAAIGYVMILIISAFASAVLAGRWASERGRSPALWAFVSVLAGAVMVAAEIYWTAAAGEPHFGEITAQLLLPIFAMLGAAAVVRQLPVVVPRIGPGPHPVHWLEAAVDCRLSIGEKTIEIAPADAEPIIIERAAVTAVEVAGQAVALRAGGEVRRLMPLGIETEARRVRVAEALAAAIDRPRGSVPKARLARD